MKSAITRLLRRLLKPLRLRMNAARVARSDEMIEGLAMLREEAARQLTIEHARQVQLTEQRQQIERGLA